MITLNETGTLDLVFSTDEQFVMDISGDSSFDVETDSRIEIIGGDPFTGSYEATSQVEADYELETNNKLMTDNVTIKKIPYEAVSNPQGGNTVTIGGY